MDTAELEFDKAFWRFSLAVYVAPGVAKECLALQETSNIDVNLLLFCAGVGAGRCVLLTQGDVERADAAVRNWRENVVHPLRGVRQTLKSLCGDCDGFRPKAKSIELEAEEMEQAMLYTHAREHWPQTCVTDAGKNVPANIRTVMLYATRDRTPYDGVVPGKLKEAAIGLSR